MALINLRNALMAGRRLPYDAEVEYLESSGAQYIDTGVLIDTSTDTVEITFMPHAETSGYQAYYGTDETGNGQFSLRKNTNGNNIQVLKGTGVSAGITADEKWHTVKVTPNKAIVDGIDIALTQADAQYTKSLMLFARITTVDTITAYAKCRLASFKIYRNGVLVRDYIPVRRGTVGYLYDRVTRKLFGNAGTGDFVLGPDVVPVEYIESHGTEYIDTGVIPVHHEAKIKFSTPTIPLSGYMCGSFTADNRYYPVAFLNRNITIFNAVNTIVAKYGNDGNPHTIVYNSNGGSCYFDDVAAGVLAQTSLTTNNPIYLFGTSTSTGPSGRVAGRLYETELKDNSIDSLVRKFRPIRVGTEGAMMDVLTRRIYRNAGTGAFTYGNDLKYPIPAA